MTLEAAISEAVRAAVAPLVETNRKLAAEIEQLRRALPAQLVTIKEAAARLGVHPNTISNRIKAGEIPVVRVGSKVRVDLSAATHAPGADEVARALLRVERSE